MLTLNVGGGKLVFEMLATPAIASESPADAEALYEQDTVPVPTQVVAGWLTATGVGPLASCEPPRVLTRAEYSVAPPTADGVKRRAPQSTPMPTHREPEGRGKEPKASPRDRVHLSPNSERRFQGGMVF